MTKWDCLIWGKTVQEYYLVLEHFGDSYAGKGGRRMMTTRKKLERLSCRKIENPEPCDCKTPADCLMSQFVGNWQAMDESNWMEEIK